MMTTSAIILIVIVCVCLFVQIALSLFFARLILHTPLRFRPTYEQIRTQKSKEISNDKAVYSDDFILGKKGDRLRFAVSEYGFNRLLKDSLDGLIDIRGSSLLAQALHYPVITQKSIDEDLGHKKELLLKSFETGEPLPKEIRRMIHDEDDTV